MTNSYDPFIRLPDETSTVRQERVIQPGAVTLSACNCDDLITALETIVKLTNEVLSSKHCYTQLEDARLKIAAERDALRAQLMTEHDTAWLATYNAVLTGVCSNSQEDRRQIMGAARRVADDTHKPRKEKP